MVVPVNPGFGERHHTGRAPISASIEARRAFMGPRTPGIDGPIVVA
jgi:hypothetical protein